MADITIFRNRVKDLLIGLNGLGFTAKKLIDMIESVDEQELREERFYCLVKPFLETLFIDECRPLYNNLAWVEIRKSASDKTVGFFCKRVIKGVVDLEKEPKVAIEYSYGEVGTEFAYLSEYIQYFKEFRKIFFDLLIELQKEIIMERV